MESANGYEMQNASVLRGGSNSEIAEAHGIYHVTCKDAEGNIKWSDTINNVVANQGKNVMLDAGLAGSAYTVVGPFLGLISSVSYGAGPVVGDTQVSHTGWVEAGYTTNYPLYTGTRKTMTWGAASNGVKTMTGTQDFVISGTGGTVKGCFVVYGTGALNTIGNTAGSLFSAGVFSGGDKVAGVGDTIQVTYSIAL